MSVVVTMLIRFGSPAPMLAATKRSVRVTANEVM